MRISDWSSYVCSSDLLTLGSDTPSIFAKYFTGPPKPEGVNFASLDNKKYIELSTQASLLPGDESCKVWAESERALFKDVDLLRQEEGRVGKEGVSTGTCGWPRFHKTKRHIHVD